MMHFEKRRQLKRGNDRQILDDLEMLRRRSQPDDSEIWMNLAVT